MEAKQSSVFVSIVGRPNVGKSSLLNHLVGEKVAIVTHKPQTTRTRITGILTKEPVQYVFFDTPGIHNPRTRLGKRMAGTAQMSIGDGDVALMLFDPFAPINEAETQCIKAIAASSVYALAAVNKTDKAAPEQVETRRQEILQLGAFRQALAISAATGDGCDVLLQVLAQQAAVGPHFFEADDYTDQPEKVLVAEIIREKLLLNLREEIPHGTAVEIERFKEREDKALLDIDAVIYCEKKSHKGMVIGKGGQMLKKVASEARADCEALLGVKVNLQCWVKIKDGWRDDDRVLNSLGFAK